MPQVFIYMIMMAKRYIDFSSGLMNVNVGHGDQRITNAVDKANAGSGLCYPRVA